ncbi:MAG: heparinase II/III domain-containing protein [Candidatus Latescibacterota bacterium]
MIPILFAFLLALLPSPVSADITSQDIAGAMRKDLRHPYLAFTEAEKPAIKERIDGDPACRDYFSRLLAESNRLLYTPVTEPKPEDRDSRFEPPTEFLTVTGNYLRAALTLAFVYQMTGEEKYAKKAFEFAKELCELRTWVMRACQFPKAYPRVSPWNVPDEKLVFTYDIIAADFSTDLGLAYDWLYPALSKEERDWLRAGLLEKAIVQVRGNYDYHWWATAYKCNWCAWCNGGLGIAALALLGEEPRLTDVVAESYNRISKTLDQVGPEGGWEEGGGYWAQTLNMAVRFADPLKRLTDGKFNLFTHPRVAKNPVNFSLFLSYPPDGRTVNFADAHSNRLGSPRLYNKIALETGNPEAAWIRNAWFGNEIGDIFDVIWPRNTVKGALPARGSLLFSVEGWAAMRSDFTDPEKVTVIAKAGKNADPHHGHLDVGQVNVYWRGEAFLNDSGTAVYDEKYFDAEKYDTPHAASDGHNLIFVNGEKQITGRLKDQPRDETVAGKILEFRPGETRDYTLLDASGAYRKEHLAGWRRHIILEKPLITVIVDEVSCAKGAEIEARFHSEAGQKARGGFTLLDGRQGDMALIPVIPGKWAFRPGRHAYLALQRQAGFQWLPYNGTVLSAAGGRTVLAHVILPVEAEDEAVRAVKSMKRSGDLSLLFEYRGKKHELRFRKGDEGLVLE